MYFRWYPGKDAIKNAIYAYEQKALKPVLDEMANNEKTYLLNMAKCLDNERLADTFKRKN